MFAKRFFYVCGGLFLLALSYHLGARTGAQAAVLPDVAIRAPCIGLAGESRPFVAAVVRGLLYVWERPNLPPMTTDAPPVPTSGVAIPVPVPADQRVVASGYSVIRGVKEAIVMHEDGDIFMYRMSTVRHESGRWQYGGNLYGARTKAEMDSVVRSFPR